MTLHRAHPAPLQLFSDDEEKFSLHDCVAGAGSGIEVFSLATPQACEHFIGSPANAALPDACPEIACADTDELNGDVERVPWLPRSGRVGDSLKFRHDAFTQNTLATDDTTATLLSDAQFEAAALCASEPFVDTRPLLNEGIRKDGEGLIHHFTRGCSQRDIFSIEAASTSASSDSLGLNDDSPTETPSSEQRYDEDVPWLTESGRVGDSLKLRHDAFTQNTLAMDDTTAISLSDAQFEAAALCASEPFVDTRPLLNEGIRKDREGLIMRGCSQQDAFSIETASTSASSDSLGLNDDSPTETPSSEQRYHEEMSIKPDHNFDRESGITSGDSQNIVEPALSRHHPGMEGLDFRLGGLPVDCDIYL